MSRFSPYTENGGSILAIAGADFCVIAGDTRQSEGYSIQSRNQSKVWRLTDKCTIAANGFAADGNQVVKRIKQRLEWYKYAHNKEMPLKAIARLVQTLLYGRRFFPYYAYVILGGIEADGTGAVYSFDPVGSYEREYCRAAGAAQSLLQPLLDNQIYFKNQQPADPTNPPIPGNLPLSDVLDLVVDAFTSATERHIEVGDGLEVYVVLAPGRSDDEIQETAQSAKFTGGVQEVGKEEYEAKMVELEEQGLQPGGGKGGAKVYRLLRDLKKD